MSAMAKMLADMLLKEVPPEVREALTPENLQRVTETVNQWLVFMKQGMEASLVMQHDIVERLERIENDYNRRSGKRASKRTEIGDDCGGNGGNGRSASD